MEATLAVVTRDLIGEVANNHENQCLNRKYNSFKPLNVCLCKDVFVSLPTVFGEFEDCFPPCLVALGLGDSCNTIGLSHD